MKKSVMVKWVTFLATLAILATYIIPLRIYAATTITSDQIKDTSLDIITWQKLAHKSDERDFLATDLVDNAGGSSSDWTAFSLGRVGINEGYSVYLDALNRAVTRAYQSDKRLSDSKPTEWHRIAITVMSIGGDPTAFGQDSEGNPVNLLADGVWKWENLGDQGINGLSWALMTLDSLHFKTPDGELNRDDLITEILKSQMADGAFSLDYLSSDVDITAMVIQALAPYYNSEQTYTYEGLVTKTERTATVRQVVDEAIEALSRMQNENGEFLSWDKASVESLDQVLVALCALGIDPQQDSRFIKNDKNILEVILSYRNEDGGFSHSREVDPSLPDVSPDESNSMASDQTLYALTAYYRLLNGNRRLYDLRPEQDEGLKANIKQLNTDIRALTEDDRNTLVALLERYNQIPVEERSYVYAYPQLAERLSRAGIENKTEFLSSAMSQVDSGTGSVIDIFALGQLDFNHYEFTAKDLEKFQTISENPTGSDYPQLLLLSEKLKDATNKADFPNLTAQIEEKLKIAAEQVKKIDSINAAVANLYPFKDLKTSDRKEIKNLSEEIKSLQPVDQEKIKNKAELESARANMDTDNRMQVILFASATITIVLIILLFFRMKSARKKRLPDYEDDN